MPRGHGTACVNLVLQQDRAAPIAQRRCGGAKRQGTVCLIHTDTNVGGCDTGSDALRPLDDQPTAERAETVNCD